MKKKQPKCPRRGSPLSQGRLAAKLDEVVARPCVLRLHLKGRNKSFLRVYPYRVAYLGGKLSLIYEDVSGHNLNAQTLSEIKSWKRERRFKFSPHYGRQAVNHFINQIRAIDGREVRLAIKVVGDFDLKSLAGHHVLRKAVSIPTKHGDTIFGAYVEISPSLFTWLYRLRDRIDILDPAAMQAAFKKFCRYQKAKYARRKSAA